MVDTAIQQTSIWHVQNVTDDAERRPLSLNRRRKSRAVEYRDLFHIHGPARIDVAGVHIKREDEMFLGHTAIRCDHGVEKKRARSEIDNERAGDTEGINIALACEIALGHGIANIAPPDHRAIYSVERIHIV